MNSTLTEIRKSLKGYYHSQKKENSSKNVKLHEPTFGEDEIMASVETMLSTFVTMGKKVKKFEREYCDYNGNQYGLMCNSGSSANLLAIAALSNPAFPNFLKKGDEVIVPALSWATTVWPIIQCGLVPVFVDVDPETLNLNLDEVSKAISPKTRAVMPIHTYGNPCDMDRLIDIAKTKKLFLIEDCCESMGAEYRGKKVGSFGDIGSFSFYFSHHITTLEGGICVTNNYDLIELLRVLRAHGWSREGERHSMHAEANPHIDPRFIFVNLGYNLRPTEVQAAIGSIQLKKLDTFCEQRIRVAEAYKVRLDKYKKHFSIQKETEDSKHVWFGLPIVLDESASFSLKEITSFLQSKGIETRPIIAGNITIHPALKMYEHRNASSFEACNAVMQRGFAIGNHQGMDEEDVAFVCDQIDAFMAYK